MSASQDQNHRQQLRRTLRTKRQSLPFDLHRIWNQQLCTNLSRFLPFLRAERLGAYWPVDGEVDLTGLFDDRFYLPILREQARRWQPKGLLFGHCGETLRLNRYDIPEPTTRKPITARKLDLLLVPLIAFNDQGQRLGMGGGYYDRTLREMGDWKRVFKLGVGFEFQNSEDFSSEAWDQPLDGVVTERTIRLFR